MPIKIQGDLPVKEILERENIFVMHKNLISDPACLYDHRILCCICHLAANE